MIYSRPEDTDPVDQGDIFDDCPVALFESIPPTGAGTAELTSELRRAYVLTQTCDLAQRKVLNVVVAAILDADELVATGALKAAEVRGNIRAGRVHGWYFLPKSRSLGLPESIVDLRPEHGDHLWADAGSHQLRQSIDAVERESIPGVRHGLT